jgi:GNAT superfamily N-acetyltransferase
MGIVELLSKADMSVYTTHTPYNMTAANISKHLELCHSNESHTVYVAENDAGQIVGYLGAHWLPYLFLDGPEGYLSELFIDDSCRSKNIGTELLEAVKGDAVKRGCSRLLLLNSRSRESYKRSFYRKKGWEEREEAANFVYNLK